MHPTKTCGQLFMEVVDKFCLKWETHKMQLFSFKLGFLAGLAEKVYMGACPAACIRPKCGEMKMMEQAAREISEIYGLSWGVYHLSDEFSDYKGGYFGSEIWLFRNDEGRNLAFEHLDGTVKNSPEWHELRGKLCGMSVLEVDLKFHERAGYDKRTESDGPPHDAATATGMYDRDDG